MPLFFQQDIDDSTKLAIWKIEEEEGFFHVPLQRDITHPHKRLQHLAGRYLLKYLFPDFPTQLIRIADTRKPFLEDEKYHFSISHCGDFAAVIVSSKYRVGIDVEVISDKPVRIMHKFLNEEEREIVNRETSIVNLSLHDADGNVGSLPDSVTQTGVIVNEIESIGNTDKLRLHDFEDDQDVKSMAKNSIVGIQHQTPNLKHQTISEVQPPTPNPKLLTLFWSAKEAMFKWWGNGKVDFSEMLHLSGLNESENGMMRGRFLKEPYDIRFPVHFKMFDGIVMAWVKTDPGVFEM